MSESLPTSQPIEVIPENHFQQAVEDVQKGMAEKTLAINVHVFTSITNDKDIGAMNAQTNNQTQEIIYHPHTATFEVLKRSTTFHSKPHQILANNEDKNKDAGQQILEVLPNITKTDQQSHNNLQTIPPSQTRIQQQQQIEQNQEFNQAHIIINTEPTSENVNLKSFPLREQDMQSLSEVLDTTKNPKELQEVLLVHSPYAEADEYKISVLKPSRFVEFEEFIPIQSSTLTKQAESEEMPVMHWEVFFMKTDFEISQRKKYTDIQELDRKIEEERQRLEALNRIEEDGLHVPITRVLDDHRLQRRANLSKNDNIAPDQQILSDDERLNKSAMEYYQVEIANKACATDSDEEDIKELRLAKVHSELELVETNKRLSNKLTIVEVKNPIVRKPVDYLNSTKDRALSPSRMQNPKTEFDLQNDVRPQVANHLSQTKISGNLKEDINNNKQPAVEEIKIEYHIPLKDQENEDHNIKVSSLHEESSIVSEKVYSLKHDSQQHPNDQSNIIQPKSNVEANENSHSGHIQPNRNPATLISVADQHTSSILQDHKQSQSEHLQHKNHQTDRRDPYQQSKSTSQKKPMSVPRIDMFAADKHDETNQKLYQTTAAQQITQRSRRSRSSRTSQKHSKMKNFKFASNILSVKVDVNGQLTKQPHKLINSVKKSAHDCKISNPHTIENVNDKQLILHSQLPNQSINEGVLRGAIIEDPAYSGPGQTKVAHTQKIWTDSNKLLNEDTIKPITCHKIQTVTKITTGQPVNSEHNVTEPRTMKNGISTSGKSLGKADNSPQNPVNKIMPEANEEREAMRQEIQQLKETIWKIQKEMGNQRESRNNVIEKISPYNIQPIAMTSHLHMIEPPVEVSRTKSILEHDKQNRQAIQSPDIDSQLINASDYVNPHGVIWHSDKRKSVDKIGKILYRRPSDKKILNSTAYPVNEEKQQFRIRPSPYRITSKQDTQQTPVTHTHSELKKKLPKEDLIQKINANQHNFRRFIKTQSNNLANQRKDSNTSAFQPARIQLHQQQKNPTDLMISMTNLRESSTNRKPVNPEQQILGSTMVKTQRFARSPMPHDNSFNSNSHISNEKKPESFTIGTEQHTINNGKPTSFQAYANLQTKMHRGNISKIEDEASQYMIQDIDDRIVNFPILPQTPTANMSSEELIQLARETFEIFHISVEEDIILNVKKYRNCVYFNAVDHHILWHYVGKFYIGGWDMSGSCTQGQKSGDGIEFYPQKYIYEGEFKDGRRHGQGTMRSHFKDTYTGAWNKGLRHGHGLLREASGTTYEGEWKEGRKEGYGKEVIADSDFYEGHFEQGLKSGLGRQTFPNGDLYQGNYYMNKFTGKGTYYWADGSCYMGDFQNGVRHGKGIWKSSLENGDMYEGEYKNDKKYGVGKYTWENGMCYIGNFENDLRHGEGVIKDQKGKVHRAIWENGIVKNKLYVEDDKKGQEPKNKRVSVDFRRRASMKDGEDPLQKRRSSMYSASMIMIDESTNQLSKIANCLRQHPYRGVQQSKLIVQNL